MQLIPLGNSVLFKFLDETQGPQGSFSERTRSGLIIPTLQATQKGERWGRVIAVGPDAEDIAVDDYILIEPLMWTRNAELDGDKFWKTNPDKILAVTNDIADTVQY
jgi:co-chaperonin GroES (HSP10)